MSKKSKSGYYFGAFVEHKIADKVALQGELQYANLGGTLEGKVDETFDGQNMRFTLVEDINFNQILIPISVKYYATPQFALYAGPSIGFSAGYKSKIKIKDANFSMGNVSEEIAQLEKEQDETFKESLKSTSINAFVGAEYAVYKGLFVEARYTLGLTNYEKEKVEGSSVKMNYFQAGLGYKF